MDGEFMNLTKVDWEVIHGMADCNLNLSETARKMFRSRTGVEYHVMRIIEKTGLDPRKFYDLMKLIEIKRGADNG